MITAQPGMLVHVVESMPKVAQGLLGGLTLAQPATRDQFIHQVGVSNGQFGKEFGAIEQAEEQLQNARIAVPQLEERRARAISADETIKSCHHAVRVRELQL